MSIIRIVSNKIWIILPLIMGFTSMQKDNDWKLEKDKDNIRVYTRSVQGSSYKEFKGIVTVKTSLSSLVALLRDVSGFTEWIDGCIEAKTLKKISDLENIGYYVSEAPWPVSDRDMVTHSKISQDANTKVITVQMEGMPTYIPNKEDIVRVPKLKGFWTFTPKPGNMVEVIYQVHAELGGSVPAWLANSTVVDNPFKTLNKLTEVVKQEKYSSQKLSYIRD